MNVATKTIQLTVPSSDIGILERISKGMGWGLCVLKAEECLTERRRDAETFARKLSANNEEFEELKSHNFYMYEVPEPSPSFVSEAEEVAYLDSLDDEEYLSEDESAKRMELWRSL